MTHILTRLFLLFALLGVAAGACAQSETFGEYTVHYIAVNSTFITPAVAEQYDIVRGRRNAFLNVSVLRNEADGSTTPVTAELSGGMVNLMSQRDAIDFREIREGEAIYYIGEFEFSNAELLRFSVDVTPTGADETFELEWETTLYATE